MRSARPHTRRDFISPHFVTNTDKMLLELEEPYILLFEKKLSTLQPMLPILEAIVQSGRPLLIIAEDVDGEALATLVVNKLRGGLRVAAVKAPSFGDRRNVGGDTIGHAGKCERARRQSPVAAKLGDAQRVHHAGAEVYLSKVKAERDILHDVGVKLVMPQALGKLAVH